MIEHFSTRSLTGADKLSYWRGLMAKTYAGLSTDPLSPHFEATVSRWNMGGIAMTRPRATPVSVERRLVEARHSGGPRLKLHVIRQGEGRAIETTDKARIEVVVAVSSSGEAAIKRLLIDGKPLYAEPPY